MLRLCFLDRTNIGNARLDNLEKDLKLGGLQYNDCLAILFPFYIAAEIPSNMMMKRFRPSMWLTFIMVFWSIAMICQGFVKNYSGLMATRVFLGVFEGGLFPGVNYYITQWYCRHECGFRMALFFSAATLAGAFGGILARGIAEMNGVGGKPAWAWIFILEGLLSIVVSFAAYWAINDYPATYVSIIIHKIKLTQHLQSQIPHQRRARRSRAPPGCRPRKPLQRIRLQIRPASYQRLENLYPHAHLHG
jgi:MFS family permease